VMIEFWASWCPGCRTANEENLRPLFAANQASKDSNLAIIAIGLTFNDDTAAAQKAVADTKEYPWPLVFDEGAKVSDAYGVGVTPCVVVISPEGVVQTFGLYRREWAKHLDDYLKQNCVTQPPK
ncbi:MAG: TlpA family protein disulfide reductase, partial [Planctomycetes bacterium]|nr:TlpA family protein disulfide reductase [Planctomycetota bacterium]